LFFFGVFGAYCGNNHCPVCFFGTPRGLCSRMGKQGDASVQGWGARHGGARVCGGGEPTKAPAAGRETRVLGVACLSTPLPKKPTDSTKKNKKE